MDNDHVFESRAARKSRLRAAREEMFDSQQRIERQAFQEKQSIRRTRCDHVADAIINMIPGSAENRQPNLKLDLVDTLMDLVYPDDT